MSKSEIEANIERLEAAVVASQCLFADLVVIPAIRAMSAEDRAELRRMVVGELAGAGKLDAASKTDTK